MRYFTILICLIVLQLKAQTYKGKWLFENTVGNVYSNEAEWKEKYQGEDITFNEKTFRFNADLTTAYLLKKNLAIGIDLSSYYSQFSSNGYTQRNNKIAEAHYKNYTFLAVPFLRYYVHPNSKSTLYVEAGGGGGGNLIHINEATNYYETGTIYTKYANSFLDHRIKTARAAIGANYFFNEYVAFNTSVGFNYTTVEYSDLVTSNYPLVTSSSVQRFDFTSKQKIISWRIGFTIMLGKKKESSVTPTMPGS